jgi:hypothetical protein
MSLAFKLIDDVCSNFLDFVFDGFSVVIAVAVPRKNLWFSDLAERFFRLLNS